MLRALEEEVANKRLMVKGEIEASKRSWIKEMDLREKDLAEEEGRVMRMKDEVEALRTRVEERESHLSHGTIALLALHHYFRCTI